MNIAGSAGHSKEETVASFGPFEFCYQTGELRKHGIRVRLQGKPAQLLRALIEHHGQVVTRDQLKDKLWSSDIFVDFESGLNTAANRLRFALGDSADHPIYIETLPKIGYRFVAPVSIVSPPKIPDREESVVMTTLLPPQAEQDSEPSATLPAGPATPPLVQVLQTPKALPRPIVLLTVVGYALLGSVLFFHVNPRGTEPSFRQITFSRGAVNAARFASNGESLLYSAAWNGAPSRIFLQKGTSSESGVLSQGPAWLAAVSSQGRAAVFRHSERDGRMILESVPVQGGTATLLSDRAQSADWGSDGSLCLVTEDSSGSSVNYPSERTIYKSSGRISDPRISYDRHQIAFLEHPLKNDDAGQVVVVDISGHARVLSSGWASVAGLAWHPLKQEIWFTAARSGINRMLMAVDLKGNLRQVAQTPGGMVLQDINAKGQVLVARTNSRMAMFYGNLEKQSVEEISLLDWSRAVALTSDGQQVLFDESGEGGGQQYSVYLYNTITKTSKRLGEGRALDLSADGRWALTQAANHPNLLTLISLNSNKSHSVPTDGLIYQWAKFFPGSDCPEILVGANRPGHVFQLYRQQLPDGHPQPVANAIELNEPVINDEGDLAAGLDGELRISVLNLRTGTIQSVSNPKCALPVRFIKGNQMLTSYYENGSILFHVLDTASGEERFYSRFEVKDHAGTGHSSSLYLSKDMKRFVYSRSQTLSDLFLVSGWN